jgi:hypothetical protein
LGDLGLAHVGGEHSQYLLLAVGELRERVPRARASAGVRTEAAVTPPVTHT